MVKVDKSNIKKKWAPVLASPAFDKMVIGESLVVDNTDLLGRVIDVNLMNLTKSSKKQSMNLKFRVIEVHEGKGMTKPTDFLLQAASIKRLVRAGRDRVDDSFLIKTKDDQYAKVKPLLITKSHQPASVQTRLRLQAVQFVRKYVQVLTYDAFMKDLVEGKMQKELRERLGKITPLRNVEIRAVEYLDNFTPRRKIEFIEETPQPAADEE